MKRQDVKKQALSITKRSNTFEQVINAVSYGYPLLNVLPNDYKKYFTVCLHGLSSSCETLEANYINSNIPIL